MKTGFLRTIWLLVGLVFPLQGWGKDYPIFVSLYDFSASNRFSQYRLTDLALVQDEGIPVRPDGTPARPLTRYFAVAESLKATFGTEVSYGPVVSQSELKTLQHDALRKMLEAGYITQDLFDGVVEDGGHWQPHQVRYAVAWSELTWDEAQEVFNGEIPWNRVLGYKTPQVPPKIWPRGKKLRIARSSLMLGLGQRTNPFSAEEERHLLAWETEKENQALAPLDRSVFPLAAEFKRAHSHPAPLAGDLRIPFLPLLGLLQAESRIQKVHPSDYAVFVETLKQDEGNYFARAFRGVVWDTPLRQFFSNDRARALARVEEKRRERRAVTEAGLDRAVLFSTLADLEKNFLPHGISRRDFLLSRASRGMLSLESARHIQETDQTDIWWYFLFPEQKAPICVLNTSVLTAISILSPLVRSGVTEDDAANGVLRHLRSEGGRDRNLFSEYWIQDGYPLSHPSGGSGPTAASGDLFVPYEADYFGGSLFGSLHHTGTNEIRIDNFDTAVAAREGDAWVAGVLLEIYETFRDRYRNAGPVEHENLQMFLDQNGLSGPNTPEYFLELFPLRVSSEDLAFTRQLIRLGGEPEQANSLDFPSVQQTENGYQGKIRTDRSAARVTFKPVHMQTLQARFPYGPRAGKCTQHLNRLARLVLAGNY